MTEKRIGELISITRKKDELLKNMYGLTTRQNQEIDREDMDELSSIMDEKDNIIKRINKLDTSFMEIFSQIKKDNSIGDIDDLDVEKYPNLKDLKESVKDVSSTLMAISLLDEKNVQTMRDKIGEAKLGLKRLKEGKKAYKGYNVSAKESILIDEKK